MSSETTNTPIFPRAQVWFLSDLSLESIADRLAMQRGQRNGCEEIPSFTLIVAGMKYVLQGTGGEDGYLLSVFPERTNTGGAAMIVDLSDCYREIVNRVLNNNCRFG